MKSNKQRGFTLVELMVVVAIIGILAAIGIPQMTKYIRNAETAEPVSVSARIAKNIQGWMDAHASTVPTTLDDSVTGKVVCQDCTGATALQTIIPEISVSADHAWHYTVNVLGDDTTLTAYVCVKARKYDDADGTTQGHILYTMASTTETEWKTHSWTTSYVTKHTVTAPTNAGGNCTTTGTVQTTP